MSNYTLYIVQLVFTSSEGCDLENSVIKREGLEFKHFDH